MKKYSSEVVRNNIPPSEESHSESKEALFVSSSFLVILLVLFCLLTLLSSDWLASEVPIVELALKNTTIPEQLSDAGIVRFSRGYDFKNTRADYLQATLSDGTTFHIDTGEWADSRRYVIKPGSTPIYHGAEPQHDEPKDEFMGQINSDVALAVKTITESRAKDASAAKSWK